MNYKFRVVPSSIGFAIGAFLYSLVGSVEPGVAFGMILTMVLCGITKQAEWY